jgi:hypothetical protein
MCGGILRSLMPDEIHVTCAWCEESKTFVTQKEWRESGWLIFIDDTVDGDAEERDFCSVECVISSK